MAPAIRTAVAWFCLAVGLAVGLAAGLAAPAGAQGVATLEAGGPGAGALRLAEELGSLADDGATRRILPLAGRGGLRNVADLLRTPGIDMAILNLDALDAARSQRLFPGIETALHYVTRLNYLTFHLLVRRETGSLAALGGQTISVGPPAGDTAITAGLLFRLLRLTPAIATDDTVAAIARLRRREIAAVALVAGRPAPELRLAGAEGLRLLAVPLTPDVVAAYVPVRLTGADYPGLIAAGAAVDTVAVGTALFVRAETPGGARYQRLAAIVEAMFTRFELLAAHGHDRAWSEVNLSAELPGWQRFPPAEAWLRGRAPGGSGQDLRAAFMRFLEERGVAANPQPMTPRQKDELFDQFRAWQATRDR